MIAQPINADALSTLWDRLWAKVDWSDLALDACWVWTGALSKKRHGHRPAIRVAGRGSRMVNPARVVCEWYHGPAPTPEHEVGHTCPTGENALCVNPRHVQWMTRYENEHHKRAA